VSESAISNGKIFSVLDADPNIFLLKEWIKIHLLPDHDEKQQSIFERIL